ncbi:hypothetical protein OA492_01970 [Pelagibacteraceae bacterium]|nr:hypothetical protein [Pelagibacteraceae bacterium]
MRTLITFFILLFSSPVVSEEISDFQIEGISIGDSLLDYINKKEIDSQHVITKQHYDYLPQKFGEAYIWDNLKTFDYISFFYKLNDSKYRIHNIRGVLEFTDVDKCFDKQKELSLFVDELMPNAHYEEYNYSHPVDNSGKSMNYEITYTSKNNKFLIEIHCTDFEEKIRIKNNWSDGLSLKIQTIESAEWLRDY